MSLKGLGGSLGPFEVGRVRKSPGGSREVPGRFRWGLLEGPLESFFFFCLGVNLSSTCRPQLEIPRQAFLLVNAKIQKHGNKSKHKIKRMLGNHHITS